VLWTAAGAVAGDVTPAIEGDCVVYAGSGPLKASDPGGTGLNCYRMSPQGAEKVWVLDGAYAVINWCTPLMRTLPHSPRSATGPEHRATSAARFPRHTPPRRPADRA
jgi:hypothetical protein